MEDQIKAAMKASLQGIKEMQDKMDDWVEGMPEETQEIREKIDASIKTIKEKLDESLKHGEKQSEEGQLQAHLGLMEAQDKLAASQKVIDSYLDQAADRSKVVMEKLELQANLAKMEVEDFWEERGPELTAEFHKSQEKMLKVAGDAAEEIQDQFKKWSNLFTTPKS